MLWQLVVGGSSLPLAMVVVGFVILAMARPFAVAVGGLSLPLVVAVAGSFGVARVLDSAMDIGGSRWHLVGSCDLRLWAAGYGSRRFWHWVGFEGRVSSGRQGIEVGSREDERERGRHDGRKHLRGRGFIRRTTE